MDTTAYILSQHTDAGRPVIVVHGGFIYNNTIYINGIILNCKRKAYMLKKWFYEIKIIISLPSSTNL